MRPRASNLARPQSSCVVPPAASTDPPSRKPRPWSARVRTMSLDPREGSTLTIPSPPNPASGRPLLLSRAAENVQPSSSATRILPFACTATSRARTSVPMPIRTVPSPSNVRSSVPSGRYLATAASPVEDPAATIFPLSCRVSASPSSYRPSKSVMTRPSSPKVGSRSPLGRRRTSAKSDATPTEACAVPRTTIFRSAWIATSSAYAYALANGSVTTPFDPNEGSRSPATPSASEGSMTAKPKTNGTHKRTKRNERSACMTPPLTSTVANLIQGASDLTTAIRPGSRRRRPQPRLRREAEDRARRARTVAVPRTTDHDPTPRRGHRVEVGQVLQREPVVPQGQPRLEEGLVGARVGPERIGAERPSFREHALVDEPLHGALRESGLAEPAVGTAAVVV